MIVAKTISAAEEKKLLQGWFDTVQFDITSDGIPELDPEEDDEESRMAAHAIMAWFEKPNTPVPDVNERAWDFVDYSKIGMQRNAAITYMLTEADFQKSINDESNTKVLDNVDTDTLLEELRKRDPDNPF